MRLNGGLAYAHSQYQEMELASRVAASNGHELVTLLYEKLLGSIEVAIALEKNGMTHKARSHIVKAQGITTALLMGLDLKNGGPLAQSLAAIYQSLSNELVKVLNSSNIDRLVEVQKGVQELAASWATIG